MFCGYLKSFLQESMSHRIDLPCKFSRDPRHRARNWEHTVSFNHTATLRDRHNCRRPPFNLHYSQRQVLLLSSFKRQKTKTQSDYIIFPQLIISRAWVWTEAAYSRALALLALEHRPVLNLGKAVVVVAATTTTMKRKKKGGGRGRWSSTTCSQAI